MAKSRARKLADIIVGAGIDINGNLTFDGGSTSADLTFADNDKANFGDASDLQIYHDSSHSYIQDAGSGNLYLRTNGTAVVIDDGTNNLAAFNVSSGEAALYYGGSGKKLATTSTGVKVIGNLTADDNQSILLGTGSDLRIKHDGTNSIIADEGGGDLIFKAYDDFYFKQVTDDANILRLNTGGDATFYANVALNQDNSTLSLGASSDLSIFHDGTDSFIKNDTGQLILRVASVESALVAVPNGAVSLYYDNSAKLATTSTGIQVTGNIDFPSSATILGGGTNTDMTIGTSTSGYQGLLKLQSTGDIQLFQYGTSWTTNVTFKGDGQVGIGTTSPDSKLTVNVTSNSDGIELQSSEVSIATLARTAVNSQVVASLDGVASRPIHIGGIVNEDVILGNAGGNVGIGNTSPTRNLTVGDTASSSYINIKSSAVNGVSGLAFGDTNDDNRSQIIFDNATDTLQIQNGAGGGLGDRGITLTSSESVGIGTSSPLYRLHVYHASNDAPMMIDSGSANGAQLRFASSGTPKHFIGCGGGMGLGDHEDLGIRALDNILFSTGGTANERMRIDSSGNVGIGTSAVTSPGLWYDATNDYLAISHWATPPTPAAMLHISDNANDIDVPQIRIEGRENPGDTKLDIAVKDSQVRFNLVEGPSSDAAAGYGLMTFKTNAAANSSYPTRGGFIFETPADSSNLVIANTGNVGIGTASPTGAKLHVAGGIKGTDLIAHDSTGINLQTDEGTKRLVVLDSGEVVVGGTSADTSSSMGGQTPVLFADGYTSLGGLRINGADTANTIYKTGGALGIALGDSNVIKLSHGSGTARLSGGHWEVLDGKQLRAYRGGNSAYGALYMDTGENLYIYNSWGAKSIVLKRDGNVGIGTTNPGAPLHVNSDTEHQIKIEATAAAGASMQLYTAGSYSYTVYQHPNANFRIGAYGGTSFIIRDQGNSADRLTIINNGNVGIGTDSPAGRLHLRDTTPHLYIQSDDGQSAKLLFGDATDNSRGGIEYMSTDDMQFMNNNLSTVMTLRYTGQVGIGETNPNQDAAVEIAKAAPNTGVTTLRLTNSVNNKGQRIDFEDDNAARAFTLSHDNGSNFTYMGNLVNEPFDFYTNSIQRMRIQSGGDVRIGDTDGIYNSNSTSYIPFNTSGKFVTISDDDGAFLNLQSESTGSDQLGGILWTNRTGASDAHRQVASIDATTVDTTNSYEGGQLRFWTKVAGSANTQPGMIITHNRIVKGNDSEFLGFEDAINILNADPEDGGSDFDQTPTNNADGGQTYWEISNDGDAIYFSSTSGGHSGTWMKVYCDPGLWAIKGSVRLTNTDGAIHPSTSSANYKFTHSFRFYISSGPDTGNLKWDADAAASNTGTDFTRAAFSTSPVYMSGGYKTITYHTNGYNGVQRIYITDLQLVKVG